MQMPIHPALACFYQKSPFDDEDIGSFRFFIFVSFLMRSSAAFGRAVDAVGDTIDISLVLGILSINFNTRRRE